MLQSNLLNSFSNSRSVSAQYMEVVHAMDIFFPHIVSFLKRLEKDVETPLDKSIHKNGTNKINKVTTQLCDSKNKFFH